MQASRLHHGCARTPDGCCARGGGWHSWHETNLLAVYWTAIHRTRPSFRNRAGGVVEQGKSGEAAQRPVDSTLTPFFRVSWPGLSLKEKRDAPIPGGNPRS